MKIVWRCIVVSASAGLLGRALAALVWLLQPPAGTLGIFLSYLFPGLLLPLNDPSQQIWRVLTNAAIFSLAGWAMLIISDQASHRIIAAIGLWLGLSVFLWNVGFISLHWIDIAELSLALVAYLGFALLLNQCSRSSTHMVSQAEAGGD